MRTLRFERLDDLGKAGFIVGLTGGLLALVPQLERLLTFQGAWQEPMVLMLLALAMTYGSLLAVSGTVEVAGLVTAVVGVVLAVFGPAAPGILGVVGGTLLYASADEERGTPRERRAATGKAADRSPDILRP